MTHEIAKLLLEHAETFLERTEAIKAALSLGMPLNEIQDYLDWLDAIRGKSKKLPASHKRPSTGSPPPRPADPGGQESADASR
jgi:DNA-binding transcriptional MerR regulator